MTEHIATIGQAVTDLETTLYCIAMIYFFSHKKLIAGGVCAALFGISIWACFYEAGFK